MVAAFPGEEAPRSLLRTRDCIYEQSLQQRVKRGIEEVKIAPRSRWQNTYVEWVIGSRRRDMFDQAIVLHALHLRCLLTAYLTYDHRFRTHLALAMDCSMPRPVASPEAGEVIVVPEVGGLHHHDERWAA